MDKINIQIPHIVRETCDRLMAQWRNKIEKLESRIATVRKESEKCESDRSKVRPHCERAGRVETKCRTFFGPFARGAKNVTESKTSKEKGK